MFEKHVYVEAVLFHTLLCCILIHCKLFAVFEWSICLCFKMRNNFIWEFCQLLKVQ